MTLTIQDLGSLGEFFGSIAVLATLVYLAFQTRQNRMAISAQLDIARIGTSQEMNLAAATSGELLEALNGDLVEPLTIEQARLHYYWRARFLVFQWNFHRLGQGDQGAGFGSEVGVRLRAYFTDFRSVEGWWEAVRHRTFSPDFVEWVEEQRSKAA